MNPTETSTDTVLNGANGPDTARVSEKTTSTDIFPDRKQAPNLDRIHDRLNEIRSKITQLSIAARSEIGFATMPSDDDCSEPDTRHSDDQGNSSSGGNCAIASPSVNFGDRKIAPSPLSSLQIIQLLEAEFTRAEYNYSRYKRLYEQALHEENLRQHSPDKVKNKELISPSNDNNSVAAWNQANVGAVVGDMSLGDTSDVACHKLGVVSATCADSIQDGSKSENKYINVDETNGGSSLDSFSTRAQTVMQNINSLLASIDELVMQDSEAVLESIRLVDMSRNKGSEQLQQDSKDDCYAIYTVTSKAFEEYCQMFNISDLRLQKTSTMSPQILIQSPKNESYKSIDVPWLPIFRLSNDSPDPSGDSAEENMQSGRSPGANRQDVDPQQAKSTKAESVGRSNSSSTPPTKPVLNTSPTKRKSSYDTPSRTQPAAPPSSTDKVPNSVDRRVKSTFAATISSPSIKTPVKIASTSRKITTISSSMKNDKAGIRQLSGRAAISNDGSPMISGQTSAANDAINSGSKNSNSNNSNNSNSNSNSNDNDNDNDNDRVEMLTSSLVQSRTKHASPVSQLAIPIGSSESIIYRSITPNKIIERGSNGSPTASASGPSRDPKLVINVLKGRNLPIYRAYAKESDTFVLVYLENCTSRQSSTRTDAISLASSLAFAKSSVAFSSLNPIWNEQLALPLASFDSIKGQQLRVVLKQFDTIRDLKRMPSDKLDHVTLAEAYLPLESLLGGWDTNDTKDSKAGIKKNGLGKDSASGMLGGGAADSDFTASAGTLPMQDESQSSSIKKSRKYADWVALSKPTNSPSRAIKVPQGAMIKLEVFLSSA